MFHSTDNSISEIQGLSSCHRLTHLSLMNNNISRIANLDNLPLKSLDLVGTLVIYYSITTNSDDVHNVVSKLWQKSKS